MALPVLRVVRMPLEEHDALLADEMKARIGTEFGKKCCLLLLIAGFLEAAISFLIKLRTN